MNKSYLLFMVILFACSANTSNQKGEKIEYIKIKNKQLIENIKDYENYSRQDTRGSQFVIMLNTKYVNDSSKEELYYEMNLYGLKNWLPKYYTVIGDRFVFMQKKPIKSKLKSKEIADSVFKKSFPWQYEQYLTHGIPPPPITYSCKKWIFINNKLVKKVLY